MIPPRAAWVAVLALMTAACGNGTPSVGTTAPAPTLGTPSPTVTETGKPGTTITTGGSDFGTMLFDGSRQAIYLFDKEKTATPACYDACAAAWPPVLTKGAPQATGQAKAVLLGTSRRTDGTTQVTYAGHPLYFYAHEGKGQVLCHDVRGFGGLWLVVTPSGEPAD